MPTLEKEIIIKLLGNHPTFKTFVETGTFVGETIFTMEPFLDELYTIEIKEEFYNSLTAKYRGTKINFILGDSSLELAKLVPNLKTDTIFFLDGHWSACGTGRGVKDCPLYEELDAIMAFKQGIIIVVDDVRLLERAPLMELTLATGKIFQPTAF